jgi:hypothetical protein
MRPGGVQNGVETANHHRMVHSLQSTRLFLETPERSVVIGSVRPQDLHDDN